MRKLAFLLLFLISITTIYSQTSIPSELMNISGTNNYLIFNDLEDITEIKIIEKNKKNKSTDIWEYNFTSDSIINGTLERNGELKSKFVYKIDSLGRKIRINEQSKNSLGWDYKNQKITYSPVRKTMYFLNQNGNLIYRMVVEFDSIKSPIKIVSVSNDNKIFAMESAEYDYAKKNYQYKVYRADGSLVLDQENNFNPDYLIDKNEYGDVTEMYWPTSNQSDKIIYRFQYEYDENRNWIKREKIFVKNGKAEEVTVIKRKIKYKN